MANENSATETSTASAVSQPKRIPMATVTVSGNVLTFKFRHGTEHTFDVSGASDELRTKLAIHGAEQKLRDSYAGSGGESTVAEAAFLKVLDAFNRQEFNVRQPGETREEPIEMLARAIENALAAAGKPKPRATILAGLEKMDKTARAAYRRNPEVAAELAKLRAESGKAVSLDSIGNAFE